MAQGVVVVVVGSILYYSRALLYSLYVVVARGNLSLWKSMEEHRSIMTRVHVLSRVFGHLNVCHLVAIAVYYAVT